MTVELRRQCDFIAEYAISRVLPNAAVKRALEGKAFYDGRLILVSVGKTSWSMAQAAYEVLDQRIDEGIVITKHGYSQGEIGALKIFEAGHPVPDENSFSSTAEVLKNNDAYHALMARGGLIITGATGTNVNDVAVALINTKE